MRPTVRLILPFIPVLAFAVAPPADAQYFGRNAVQWDHLGKELLHADFYRVSADERITLNIPIELRGTAPGRWTRRPRCGAPTSS